MSPRRPAVVRTIAAVAVGAIVASIVIGVTLWKQGAGASATTTAPIVAKTPGDAYPGNPTEEARLVQAESQRLVYVRTVSSAARWRVDGLTGPYRIRTGNTFTLVLPAQAQPYTIADLISLAPDTFVQQSPNIYLLKENIAVLAGATLEMTSTAGLTIRMDSSPDVFVSIVSLGGSVSVLGTPTSPVTLTSWNTATNAVDTNTADGRAYIRVIGGHASLAYANVSNLGFWSGDTGGLSLTGTDTVATFDAQNPDATAADGSSNVAGAQLVPSSDLSALSEGSSQSQSLVSAGIDHVAFNGNAFGLFVTNADGVAIHDTEISHSLVDGLVLHRFVSDATISTTSSTANAVDGFTVGRSSSHVTFTNVTAASNGGNGISIDGQSLATGPNATGTAVQTYGSNSVTGSTITGNKRYGLEISGGRNTKVTSTTLARNDIGIVVNHAATNVEITGNSFTNQVNQAIAVRDTVLNASVTKNLIVGGNTGVYVRNASALLTANKISRVTNHGVSLVGNASAVHVVGNTVAGYGSKALWVAKATGVDLGKNNTDGWHPAPTVTTVVNWVFQPLTIVWLLLGALLLGTALSRRRKPKVRGIRHPYAEQVPLTSLTPGIISREALGRGRG
jgi:nitrous oxidase accessory protein NosD